MPDPTDTETAAGERAGEHPEFAKFLSRALSDPEVAAHWRAGLPERMAHTVQWHLDPAYRDNESDRAPSPEYVAAVAAAINHHMQGAFDVSLEADAGRFMAGTDRGGLPPDAGMEGEVGGAAADSGASRRVRSVGRGTAR